MRLTSIVFTLALLIGFSSQPLLAGEEKISVLSKLGDFSQTLHSEHIDYKQLEATLEGLFKALENIDPSAIDMKEVTSHTNQIIRTSAGFRRELVQKIPEWQAQKVWTEKSETTVRNIIRGLRYFEDSIGEHSLGLGDSKQKPVKMKSFTGGEPFVITNNGQFFNTHRDFKAGDIILMRGNSEVSAAIARVGDINMQFSHVAVITADPKTGKLFVAESLIEKGVILSPLEHFVDHGIGRAVLYRSEDPKVGARASEKAWDLTHDGNKYLYDFSMDTSPKSMVLTKDSRFFCSKVIKYAFESDDFKIPLFETKVNPANRSFLRSIGVQDKTTQIFAPSDMELDHRFTAVAEFRDLNYTTKNRVNDMILDKIFQWLDEGGQFKKFWALGILTSFGNRISKIPMVKKALWALGVPVAPHVSSEVLQAVTSVSFIRAPLIKELQPKIDLYVSKYGVVPPPRIISAWLDDIREQGTNKAFKVLQLGPKNPGLSCLKFY